MPQVGEKNQEVLRKMSIAGLNPISADAKKLLESQLTPKPESPKPPPPVKKPEKSESQRTWEILESNQRKKLDNGEIDLILPDFDFRDLYHTAKETKLPGPPPPPGF